MEDHMRAVDVGGDDVLTKPINKLELLLRVKSLLRVRELTEELAEHSRLVHRLLKAYVSDEAAERYLADPASVGALDRLESVH
jgi:DNA-binding response OmpR family regulator